MPNDHIFRSPGQLKLDKEVSADADKLRCDLWGKMPEIAKGGYAI